MNRTNEFPDWKEAAAKQRQIERALLARYDGPLHAVLEGLLKDEEIALYHAYANAVSIRRLGYNDHGPVHARITTYNALKILDLLSEADVRTSLEKEEIGSLEDSRLAVAIGCFLHDVGMAVTRDDHEWHSIVLTDEILCRHLEDAVAGDRARRVVLRSMIHEVIVGHMGHSRIHSIEAGVVLVADGTDMSRGRSRIPLNMELDPSVGDMHRFSSSSINRVDIAKGELKPVRITVHMDDPSGLFQIEEVLMSKVKRSPIMGFLEIVADVAGQNPRFYLR